MPLVALPLALLALIVLELWILVKLGSTLGILPTIALVLGAGIVGAWIAKWQGLQAILRVQNDLQQGVIPTRNLGDGVLILVAGMLLLLPGVVSDILGIALLIPPIRHLAMFSIRSWLNNRVHLQTTSRWQAGPGKIPGDGEPHDPSTHNPSTIVDAHVIDTHIVEDD